VTPADPAAVPPPEYVPAIGDVICSPDYMKVQYVVTGPLEMDPYGNPSVPTWSLWDREENRFYRPSRYAVKLRDATDEERRDAGINTPPGGGGGVVRPIPPPEEES